MFERPHANKWDKCKNANLKFLKKVQGLHLVENSSMNPSKGNMSLKDAKLVKH